MNSASSLSAMWCVQCRDNRRCLVHRAKAIRALSQKMQVFVQKNQHEQMQTDSKEFDELEFFGHCADLHISLVFSFKNWQFLTIVLVRMVGLL